MTHQPQKPQPPRQMTQDLFERLKREQKIVTVTVLCGDVIKGHIIWVDLIGFEFKALDSVNHYFPKRNIQSISWC